jgi:N-acyl-phosphatidylethanolamine-hydrolysing phospholipase D
MRIRHLLAILLVGLSVAGCRFFTRNFESLFRAPQSVPNKLTQVVRPDARLAVLWIGHATALVQIDDKFILTDPVFTSTVGQFSKRVIEPGLDPENVPPVSAVLISHMHFDHLSYGSLSAIEDRIHRLVVPEGGLVYIPDYRFDALELPTWRAFEEDGMRITAVPVRHVGWRYGADHSWMTRTFSGYVIEYRGVTVYYGGDTGYEPKNFEATAARFPHIDLALLPVAPIHPRDFMEYTHEDPPEAVQAFLKLRARWMVPIHYDTFVNSLDAPGEAKASLEQAMRAHGLTGEDVRILDVGQQHVFLTRSSGG